MCYKKPGPRCSAHARETLREATFAFQRAVEQDNEAFEAYHEFREAEKAFWTTPAGQKVLQARIETEQDSEKKFNLTQALEDAKQERADALTAYRNAFPSAPVEKEDLETRAIINEDYEHNSGRLAVLLSRHRAGRSGVSHPNLKEIRSLLKETPKLYTEVIAPEESHIKADLSAEDRYILAEDQKDTISLAHLTTFQQARENPEKLKQLAGTLRDLHKVDPNDKRIESAYKQATYLQAYNNLNTGADVDEFVGDGYPYELHSPTALGHILFQKNLDSYQATTLLTGLLEKSPWFGDYLSARSTLTRSDGGQHPSMFSRIGVVTGRTPVPNTPREEDIKTVNTPHLNLSNDRYDQEKVRFANARIDATAEGWGKLQHSHEAAINSNDSSMIQTYRERITNAIEYQVAWWETKKAHENYGRNLI